jgi:dihydrofolate reductase
MRKIIGAAFQSLDGVMQAPGGPSEDPADGFTLGGWVTGFWDQVMDEAWGALFAAPYELLLGRKTYDIFAAHWPYVTEGDDRVIADQFNSIAKYVVTSSTAPLGWNNSHAIGGDVAARLAVLKARDGPDLLVQGSSTLYPLLFANGLIDRLVVATFPVVLGGGKRLFGPGPGSTALTLRDHRVTASGVTIASYDRAGAVPLGSFALSEADAAEKARQEQAAA